MIWLGKVEKLKTWDVKDCEEHDPDELRCLLQLYTGMVEIEA